MFHVKRFGTIGGRKSYEAAYIGGLLDGGIARKVCNIGGWQDLETEVDAEFGGIEYLTKPRG